MAVIDPTSLLGRLLAAVGLGRRAQAFMNVHVLPDSRAARSYGAHYTDAARLGDGATQVAGADLALRYFGGRTIADLVYVNLYVGGENRWRADDIARINWALLEALTDANLNGVLLQYFAGPIGTRCGGSQIVEEIVPDVVYKDTLERWLVALFRQGALAGYDLTSTSFDFLLPPGVRLVDGAAGAGGTQPDSAHGLAGYHGSIHETGPDGAQATLYYAVAVYSQTSAAGVNGIVAFDEPWKNVVATLYHELEEVRTDPDVADALAAPTAGDGQRHLGWVSDNGAEIGDLPLIASGGDLRQVMHEVVLANGQGKVPVQLLWSNAARGAKAVPAQAAPRPLDMLAVTVPGEPEWTWPHTRALTVQYLAWDGRTACKAVIVVPAQWQRSDPPMPLVISPHGRNNCAFSNAFYYWQDSPARGPFAVICPDGLARAHDAASDPFDRPPSPWLFTYGNRGHIDDLARMPQIARDTIGLRIDPERIYVLGSSMGGQETLLLAARYPKQLAGGYGRLAGAAAFDTPCDMATQCGYLTHVRPSVAAIMIEEIGTQPASRRGWNESAKYFNEKTQQPSSIGQLLKRLPKGQKSWDERGALSYVNQLAHLPFPLEIYWSAKDTVVANQDRDQSGKLYRQIMKANPRAPVTQISGNWAHSAEFVPDQALGAALQQLGLIQL